MELWTKSLRMNESCFSSRRKTFLSDSQRIINSIWNMKRTCHWYAFVFCQQKKRETFQFLFHFSAFTGFCDERYLKNTFFFNQESWSWLHLWWGVAMWRHSSDFFYGFSFKRRKSAVLQMRIPWPLVQPHNSNECCKWHKGISGYLKCNFMEQYCAGITFHAPRVFPGKSNWKI